MPIVPFRFQIDASKDGTITVGQLFDAEVTVDPITEEETLGRIVNQTAVTEESHPELFAELSKLFASQAAADRAVSKRDALRAERQARADAEREARRAARAAEPAE